MERLPFEFSPTFVLILANCGMYVYTSILGGNFIQTSQTVMRVLGQNNFLVMRGCYWQLFTSMFVHADIVHITMNMFFLLIFGLRAEGLFRQMEYYAIYLLSGLMGGLFSLSLGPNVVSVGASGAIFGLFGAAVIYLHTVVGRPVMDALIYAIFFFVITSFSPQTNVLAHLGGLVTGLVLGYVLAKSRTVIYTYRFSHRIR